MRALALAGLMAAAAGCATAQEVARSAQVAPATADAVAGCVYLDDVTGTSGLYGVFGDRGVENARGKALEKAATLGATHVVWGPGDTGYGSTSATAKAYRCGQ